MIWLLILVSLSAYTLLVCIEIKYQHNLQEIMSKLNDLAGTLQTLDATVKSIKTNVDALVAATKDTELPADAQTALDALQSDVASVATDFTTTTPPAA